MLIWWLDDDPALPVEVASVIADPRSEVFVSSIALAEISVKRSIGKLRAPWIPDAVLEENGLVVLDFTSDDARRLLDLPLRHRDPFDRMLVAQALENDLTLATADARLAGYGIRTLPAT
jgi:PIN domain nuclease of toxin-antitoxin system